MVRKTDGPKLGWSQQYVDAEAHWRARDREDSERMKARKCERDNSDALERLEKWLEKKRRNGWLMPLFHKRWGRYAVTLQRGAWRPDRGGYKAARGTGKTLAKAIHAALDTAEAKR